MKADLEIKKRHLKKINKNDDTSSVSDTEEKVDLQRNVGIFGGISMITGLMIGSGIFISPKGVLEGAGSVGMSLIIWAIGGILSMFGAVSFVELGTMIPKSGGDYAYLMEAYHPIIAFLYSYVSVVLMKPSSSAIICMSCAGYIVTPFFNDGCGSAPNGMLKFLAIAVLFTVSAINIYSSRLATRVQVFFTGAKILALVIIIIGGVVKLIQGYTEYLQDSFKGTNSNIGELAVGLYSSLWAYDGWSNLNFVTEEIEKPSKTLPRSIFISVPLVTILYILTNVSYFTVLSPEALLDSPAVAVSWAELVIPKISWIIPIFVAMSTFGAVNGSMFSSGRLSFVTAREKHTIKVMSFIDVNRCTPSPAIILTTVIAVPMILSTDIGSLIDFFSFAAWMFYALVFSGLLVLRYTQPDAHRPYKVPIIFPVLALLLSLILVVAPIVQAPQIEFLYAFLFILSGLFFYFPFVHFKKEIPGMESFTIAVQMLLNVTPPGGVVHTNEVMDNTKENDIQLTRF